MRQFFCSSPARKHVLIIDTVKLFYLWIDSNRFSFVMSAVKLPSKSIFTRPIVALTVSELLQWNWFSRNRKVAGLSLRTVGSSWEENLVSVNPSRGTTFVSKVLLSEAGKCLKLNIRARRYNGMNDTSAAASIERGVSLRSDSEIPRVAHPSREEGYQFKVEIWKLNI